MVTGLDIEFLKNVAGDPRASVRERLAIQLSRFVDTPATAADERVAVTPILLMLANDPVVAVRKTLADAIATSPRAPRDVLRALVCDIDDICVPLLRAVTAMPDSDLAAVAKTGPLSRQMAIVFRDRIGPGLARVIVETCPSQVCARLLQNGGSQIDRATYDRLFEQHGSVRCVREALLARANVPMHIPALIMAGRPSGDAGTDGDAREKMLLSLAAQAGGRDLADMAVHLHRSDLLTDSLVLRAAFTGNMDFVECAIAVMGAMPRARVHALLLGSARLGARAAFLRAGLPASAYRGFRVALDVYSHLRKEGGGLEPAAFTRRMIERVVTAHEGFQREDQRFLLDMLARLGPEDVRPLATQLACDLAAA